MSITSEEMTLGWLQSKVLCEPNELVSGLRIILKGNDRMIKRIINVLKMKVVLTNITGTLIMNKFVYVLHDGRKRIQAN
jgi:hypothetical protein